MTDRDTSGELDPVPAVLSGMPAPAVFAQNLRGAIDQGVDRERAARGGVTGAEDTYALQRMLAGSLETCKDFENAFKAGRVLLAQYQEEELGLAVGEQDGQPNQGITIPSADGDIRLTLDRKNTHHIDAGQLAAAVIGHLVGEGPTGLAAEVTDVVNGDHPSIPADQLETVLVSLCERAMEVLTSCGNFTPQVTKVRAYAKTLARQGDDALSKVVADTIATTSEYLGVKTSRKA